MVLDKAFLVVVGSELFGNSFGVVRWFSMPRMIVDMEVRPPVGLLVTVHFQHVRDDGNDEIVARCTVDRHLQVGEEEGGDGLVVMRVQDFVATQTTVAHDRIQ